MKRRPIRPTLSSDSHWIPPSNGDTRWKWLAGSAAVGAAAAAMDAQAETVQIDLINNKNTTTTKALITDLTGDGIDDWNVIGTQGTSLGDSIRIKNYLSTMTYAAVVSNGNSGWVLAGSASDTDNLNPVSVSDLIPVSFSDANFNGGAETNGFVEVRASYPHEIELLRLVFDDASTTAPTGVVAGGTNTKIGSVTGGVFAAVAPPVVDLSPKVALLNRKIKKLKKKLKKAKRRR